MSAYEEFNDLFETFCERMAQGGPPLAEHEVERLRARHEAAWREHQVPPQMVEGYGFHLTRRLPRPPSWELVEAKLALVPEPEGPAPAPVKVHPDTAVSLEASVTRARDMLAKGIAERRVARETKLSRPEVHKLVVLRDTGRGYVIVPGPPRPEGPTVQIQRVPEPR